MFWRELMLAAVGDATVEEKARLARIAFRIVVAVHIVWVCGWLAPLGLSGAVFANDMDPMVQAAVEPVRSELGKVAARVEGLEDKLDYTNELVVEVLIGNLANQLRDLNRLRCSTSDEHGHMRLERDIEEGQQKYKELTGERYPLAACKDL